MYACFFPSRRSSSPNLPPCLPLVLAGLVLCSLSPTGSSPISPNFPTFRSHSLHLALPIPPSHSRSPNLALPIPSCQSHPFHLPPRPRSTPIPIHDDFMPHSPSHHKIAARNPGRFPKIVARANRPGRDVQDPDAGPVRRRGGQAPPAGRRGHVEGVWGEERYHAGLLGE